MTTKLAHRVVQRLEDEIARVLHYRTNAERSLTELYVHLHHAKQKLDYLRALDEFEGGLSD